MYLERFKLDGRVAVVTGGAQAIELTCVEAFSEAGAHVTSSLMTASIVVADGGYTCWRQP
jgi:NAD(P)-dependent dehydrogenase (short-subunit alcohol dehydrogenase family)